jgi:hypothetical protein
LPEPDVSLCPSLRNTLASFAPSHGPLSTSGPQKVTVVALAGEAAKGSMSAVVIKNLFMRDPQSYASGQARKAEDGRGRRR